MRACQQCNDLLARLQQTIISIDLSENDERITEVGESD